MLAACSFQEMTQPPVTESPTSAPLQTLDGTKWTLTFLNGAAPVSSSTITLAFYPESYLEGDAGCNSYGGDYVAENHRFQVPLIHRTQDPCEAPDIMQQEAAFFAVLSKVATYRATEERLEFDDAQGRQTLAFARVHPPSTGTVLPGTKYVLTSLRGQPLLAGTHITLEFGKQSFGGFTGCNDYGGGPDDGKYAATDDGALKLLEFAVTAVGCPGDIMAQEKTYLEALTSAAAYRLSNRRLELQNAAGETILVYAQRAECAEGAASLAGTAWRLASVDGQAPSNAAANTLAFVDDKWYVEHSTCQGYVSSYQTSGNDLSSGFSAWLGQICQDAEDQGVTMLESPSDYCLTQGRLRITTTSGRVFVYDPRPETARPPLEGPTWSLLSFVGQRLVEGEVAPWPDPFPVREGSEITLTLANGIASGSAGCNTYQSTYNRGATITFGPFAVTKKACSTPEGMMTQEQRYLGALHDVTGYRLVGSELWLERDGRPALVFARIVPTPTPTSTSTPLPTNSAIALPTDGPITLPTQTPAPTVLPALTDRPTLTLTPIAVPTSMPAETPAASPTPKVMLSSPLVVDSEAGRLYVSATIDGVQQVAALAATDGHLLTTYAVAGPFAVDGVHGWLYVDRAEAGLTVLDARTGVPHASIALPSRKNERAEHLKDGAEA